MNIFDLKKKNNTTQGGSKLQLRYWLLFHQPLASQFFDPSHLACVAGVKGAGGRFKGEGKKEKKEGGKKERGLGREGRERLLLFLTLPPPLTRELCLACQHLPPINNQ